MDRHAVDTLDNLIDPVHSPPHLGFRVGELRTNGGIDKNAQVRFIELNQIDADLADPQKLVAEHRH